jgi:hypothetical protein
MWFDSQKEQESFLFSRAPSSPLFKRGRENLSPKEKQLGHVAYHSSPSSSEVKNVWSSVSSPP